MNFYKGKILISTPETSGDIFSRSVILIIEHDKDGAFGLILNKKNKVISEDISKILDFPFEIYDGGPVSKDRTFFIVKGQALDFYHKINDKFSLTEDSESIISNILTEKLSPNDVKIFSGYSGWAPHQLEDEISRNVWTIIDQHQIDYTAPNDQNLWKEIMQNLGGEYLLWANSPENISMN